MALDRRHFLFTTMAFMGVTSLLPGKAEAKPRTFEIGGKAIRGYDPVAYFTAGKPIKGKRQFSTKWNGSTWLFSSKANLDAFEKSPKKFAPLYGGYCSWAMSQGRLATTVPEAWDIVNGKLYLNYSLGIRQKWRSNIPSNIRQANRHWPQIKKTLS